MKTRLVRIGNSRGVRLSKALLESSGLADEVEISVQKNRITITSSRKPRQGWEEQFARMHAAGDDRMIDPPLASGWDETEWVW